MPADETTESGRTLYAAIVVPIDDTAHEDTWPAIDLVHATQAEIDAIKRDIQAGGRWPRVDTRIMSAAEYREVNDYLFPTPDEAERVEQEKEDRLRQDREAYEARNAQSDRSLEDVIAKYGNKTVADLKAMRTDEQQSGEG